MRDNKEIGNYNEDLVVGDDRCTIESVCEELTNCNSTGILWSKLAEIATNLGLPDDDVIRINASLTIENKTCYAVLTQILLKWQSKEGTNAKLNILVSVLKNVDLQLCADALRMRFCCGNESVIYEGVIQSKNQHVQIQDEILSAEPEASYIDDNVGGSTTRLLQDSFHNRFNDTLETRRVATLHKVFLRIAPISVFFLMCASFLVWVLIAFVSEKTSMV